MPMSKNTAAKKVISICQKLYHKNLVSAFGGNVSIRVNEQVIITPAGFPLGDLCEDDLVTIDLFGSILTGKHQPSSEKLMHLQIYNQRPEIKGVVHTHSPAATAFAYLSRKILPINPESTLFLADLPIIPFKPFGSKELADEVGNHLREANAGLLAKHGVITIGPTLDHAFHLAELVEETALMNLYVQMLQMK